MEQITVLPVGTRVALKAGALRGHITDVNIKAKNYVQYRVVWWEGDKRCVEWLEQNEAVSMEDFNESLEVGFKP